MTTSIAVTRDIRADPQLVWSMISDVTRMGDWSPETTSCAWTKGSTGPVVGARFKGRNRNGKKSWATTCVVTEAEPGRSFGFLVKGGPLSVALWEYRITSTETGCRVEERWTDRRNGLLKATGKPISGVEDRPEHNRAGMETTLERLAAAAEAGAGA